MSRSAGAASGRVGDGSTTGPGVQAGRDRQAPQGQAYTPGVDQAPALEVEQGTGHRGGARADPQGQAAGVGGARVAAHLEERQENGEGDVLVHDADPAIGTARASSFMQSVSTVQLVSWVFARPSGAYNLPVLPPCGIYRTRSAIGSIPAECLVYFHNHGDPGPGLYLPSAWKGNRARFDSKGVLLPDEAAAEALEPLPAEGFYRVVEPFHCCEKHCRLFSEDMLVQLGYDGSAVPILFVPEIIDGQLAIPERGTRVDVGAFARIAPLKVSVTQRDTAGPALH